MLEFNNPTVTEKQIEKQQDPKGASVEDLGLQFVDNDNVQLTLSRPG